MKKAKSSTAGVEQILQKKNYLEKPTALRKISTELDTGTASLELLVVLLVFIAGLGEWKQINVVLGGIPKVVTLGVIAIAVIYALVTADFSDLHIIWRPLCMYLLLIFSIWACTLYIWMTDFTSVSSMFRGSSKLIFQLIAVFVAISAVYLFRERSIDLFAFGISAANFAIMLLEIPNYGLIASLKSLFHLFITMGDAYGYALTLEIHEITFLYGIFLVYYIVFAPRETKRQRRTRYALIAVSVFFLMTGMKRILIPSCILSIIFAVLVKKRKNASRICKITGICWIAFFVFYLYAIRYGLVSFLVEKLNIDTMGRDYIWKLAEPYYYFSPRFIGNGFEAVDSIVKYFYRLGLIDEAYPFHNDILKVYVELGFYGFLLWSGIQYLLFPWFWEKFFGKETAVVYMSIMNLMTLTYLTDNTAFYFWCTIAIRIVPLAYYFTVKREAPKPKWRLPDKAEVQRLIDENMQEGLG